LPEVRLNKTLSDFIEDFSIALFKIKNKKKSDLKAFQECSSIEYNDIQSVYKDCQLFESCSIYNPPAFVGSRIRHKVQTSIFKMDSMFKPVPIFQKPYDSLPENKQIYFEEIKNLRSDAKEKTCLVYLHGFSESGYTPEKILIFKELIAKMPEMEVLAVQLPYHMMRSPKNQPYSGAYFLDSYPIVTIESFRQAVNDVSQVLSYAKEKYKNVIVAGFSLGGFVVSFLGTCDDRADLYIIGQAGVHIPKTLINLSICPGLSEKKDNLIKQGVDFESLFEPIELSNYQSILPSEKVISIAGLYDKLIAFEDVEMLRCFFNGVYNINYSAGHRGIIFEMKKIKMRIMKIIDSMATQGYTNL
jgi:hypothetical protein